LYGKDFHYYVIYYLMRGAGYADRQAYLGATFSQYVDDCPETEPVLNTLSHPNIVNRYHFYDGGPNQTTVAGNTTAVGNLATAAAAFTRNIRKNGEPSLRHAMWLGRWLHTVADTYAHEGFSANKAKHNARGGQIPIYRGHANAPHRGHAPDMISLDSAHRNKAVAAAKLIFDTLWSNSPKAGPPLAWAVVESDLVKAFYCHGDASHPDGVEDEEERSQRVRQLIRDRFGAFGEYTGDEYNGGPLHEVFLDVLGIKYIGSGFSKRLVYPATDPATPPKDLPSF
jgi:hypothetical protein